MADHPPLFTPLPVQPHPSVSSQPEQQAPDANPHFARLGGEATLEQLVERFYHHMETLPEAGTIRAMHAANLSEIKRVLVRYLVQWPGGPANYSAERGHPRLRRRHLPFAIGIAERDAWMACMRRALSEVVADEALRDQLDARFAQVADFMRNQPEK